MIGFQLTHRDRSRLVGVHPHLVQVITEAAAVSPERFVVLEGLRTMERQRELFAKRATRTLNSRHLTGHAVDIAPLLDEDGDGDVEISWHWEHYYPLADLIKRVAGHLGIPITWGGDWTFKDGPHWELPWQLYPIDAGENAQQVAEGVKVAQAAPGVTIHGLSENRSKTLQSAIDASSGGRAAEEARMAPLISDRAARKAIGEAMPPENPDAAFSRARNILAKPEKGSF